MSVKFIFEHCVEHRFPYFHFHWNIISILKPGTLPTHLFHYIIMQRFIIKLQKCFFLSILFSFTKHYFMYATDLCVCINARWITI